ncbi:KCNF1 [Symbiodinium sp. CCMP2592]|nr:KCNF1 [Symbiodinium sp. CCMP2592]
MATTTAELEAKLRRRMEKCEGSNAMSPKRGQRVWSDEMAKTVSQQRRARLSKGQSQGSRGGAGNPQDVEGMDVLPRSISASSSSRPPRVQGEAETAGGWLPPARIYRIATIAGCILLAFLLIWGQFGRAEVTKRHPDASNGQDGWRSLEPQEKDTFAEAEPTVSASPGGVPLGDDSALSSDQPVAGMLEEEAEPDLGNAEATAIDFHGMVKDASIASHGPSVSIDARTSGDVSDDWHIFLDQHPALEQVFSLGKVTFSKHSSRSSSLTLNATITNTGSTAWSSAVLQAVHGSDMGISSLPLSGVVEPGKDCKVSLRLRLPHEDVIPASMWALSIDDRVFGPLLLLELEQEEDASGSSVPKEQRASARIFEAPRRLLTDQALREDAARVGDISEEWAADLAKTGMAQAPIQLDVVRHGQNASANSCVEPMAGIPAWQHRGSADAQAQRSGANMDQDANGQFATLFLQPESERPTWVERPHDTSMSKVTKSSPNRMASFELLVHLTLGTQEKVFGQKAPASVWSVADLSTAKSCRLANRWALGCRLRCGRLSRVQPRQAKEDPEEIIQDSVVRPRSLQSERTKDGLGTSFCRFRYQ